MVTYLTEPCDASLESYDCRCIMRYVVLPEAWPGVGRMGAYATQITSLETPCTLCRCSSKGDWFKAKHLDSVQQPSTKCVLRIWKHSISLEKTETKYFVISESIFFATFYSAKNVISNVHLIFSQLSFKPNSFCRQGLFKSIAQMGPLVCDNGESQQETKHLSSYKALQQCKCSTLVKTLLCQRENFSCHVVNPPPQEALAMSTGEAPLST